jgi:hypothetical protein
MTMSRTGIIGTRFTSSLSLVNIESLSRAPYRENFATAEKDPEGLVLLELYTASLRFAAC